MWGCDDDSASGGGGAAKPGEKRMVVWRFWGSLTGFDRGGLFKTVLGNGWAKVVDWVIILGPSWIGFGIGFSGLVLV